ncbi:MAG: HAD-IA family hydrolase [Elusimicrobiaceae bacterium]|nr:HAD-IA family hydrolase [Elusimicrobiaceae bacterium]
MFIEKAKKLINRHTVISFDIFDTLLIRPYLRPTDLFVHLEKLNQLPGFETRRRLAERTARHKRPEGEDVNLDEIYAELSGPDVALKQQELDLERQTLQPNPALLMLFRYAKQQGKRIIIVSDMYLPADFLEQVLREKGFDGFEKLYVSNRPRKQKGYGTLYYHVEQDLHLDPKTILHIGDNRRSDVRCAKKAGWHALHIPSLQERYFQKYPLLLKFWKQHPSFDASVTLGLLIWKEAQGILSPYFERLGYKIGGPASYGFTRWIEKQATARHIPTLLFVARDGYTLQKVFQTFDNPHIQAHYVYALRFLNNICRLDYPPTSMGQMKTILRHFANKSDAFRSLLPAHPMNKAQTHRFIQDHLPLLTQLSKQELSNYRNYLSAYYQPGKPVGAIDSVTSFFSSQKLIEAAVGVEQVTGYYWGVTPTPEMPSHRFEAFLPHGELKQHHEIFTHCWPFMEFLFTAPQPPIKNITPDGSPLYDSHIPAQEEARIAAYETLSNGMLAFANDVKHIFKGKDIFLTGHFLVQWINWFLLHPTREDRKEMAVIFHASGSEHQEYEPLLSFQPSIRQILSSVKHYIRCAKQVYWKTPFQFCLTCLLSPVASRRIADKHFVLYFFPRLRKQYARKDMTIGRYTFSIVWGKRQE